MDYDYIRQELLFIADLIEKKNTDYGSAYETATKMFRDYRQSKIFEKFMRINTLSHQENQVEGEGIKDALRDIIGYSVLYLEMIHRKEVEDKHAINDN